MGSWYALMSGMGVFPDVAPASVSDAAGFARQRTEMKEFLRRCALNFRSQAEVLEEMAASPKGSPSFLSAVG